jgi:hypothetical protein
MSEQNSGRNVDQANRQLQALASHGSGDVVEFLSALIGDVCSKHADTGATICMAPGPDGVARTRHGVFVNSKELVMQVFLDADENYSVSGYAARARDCFGEIYLSLDKGPEYDRQATKVNEAIKSIGAGEAFDLAMETTRAVLAANAEALADPAAHIQMISVKVLAALCTAWFDLPDRANIFEGGLRAALDPPCLCPGDFAPPSGYMFKPDPEMPLSYVGPFVGGMLKRAVMQFVADMRAADKQPTGVLSRVVFENFSLGEEDLIARTIIGVLMGMLPTIDGNLNRAVNAWRGDGTFSELQSALQQHDGVDPYARASEVLKRPLMHAMQFDPVPEAVWRTAVKPHTLGTTNPVQVNPGDKIYVGIANATKEDLLAGDTDVFPVFGGNRNAAPHPQHACPGYEMAMGIMLGVINGMMEPT